MTQTKKQKLVTPGYVILCFAYFAAQFGYSMTSSNITKYAKFVGVSGAILGVLPGLMSLAALFSRPVAGWISDHFDRKRMMVLTLISMAAVFVAYVFSTNVALLLLVRILHGIIFSIFSTVNLAFVADAVPRDQLTNGMGYYALMGNLSMAFAPAVGAKVIERWNYTVLFLGAAGLYTLSFLLVNFVKKNEANEQEKEAEAKLMGVSKEKKSWWKNLICMPAVPAAAISMCNALLSGAITGFLLLFAENRSVENAGLFFTLYAFSNLLARPFIMKMAEKVPREFFVYFCNSCLIMVILLIMNLTHTWQAAAAGIFFGIGYGGLQPIMQSMALGSVSISERGSASSTYYIGLDIGMALGPMIVNMIAGWFNENYGIGYAFLIIPIVMGAVIMFFVARRSKQSNRIY